MKAKRLTILLLCALLLSACGGGETAAISVPETVSAVSPEETPQPTTELQLSPEPLPEKQPMKGTAAADGVGALREQVPADTVLKITGEYGEYYLVEWAGESLLVHKSELHCGEEKEPAEGTAGEQGADLYAAILSEGEELTVLTAGEKLCLLEINGGGAEVPRWAVLLEGEELPEKSEGYAKKGALLYADSELRGTGKKLKTGTALTLLPGSDGVVYVLTEDGERGYLKVEDVTDEKPKAETAAGTEDPWTPPVI